MIITCPACHAQFHLQPAALGTNGRTVRCSSCGERWFAEPFIEAPTEPPPMPAVAAVASGAVVRRFPLTSWLAGALVLLLLAALVAGRDEIATRVPAMISLYQRFGLSLELPLEIEFRGLASERRVADGRQVLVVTGEISNISSWPRPVPPIRVALLDGRRREVGHELFAPPRPALGPGDVARFEVAMSEPAEEASDVEVSFGSEPRRP